MNDVYAAGDVTTWPVRQGGLAAQQADAVAESLPMRTWHVRRSDPSD
ncbi:MAG: hypothetical protein ACR2ML_12365 [Solirubrobacteraceae bacterium]